SCSMNWRRPFKPVGSATTRRRNSACGKGDGEMRRATGVVATSAVDADDDQLSERSLQALVDQVNDGWMPVVLEHDPRNPPVGRVVAAKLVRRQDESFAVEGEFELFENGDEIPLSENRKEPDLERDFAVMFD